MDAIETIDWGAYAHFAFIAGKDPEIVPFAKAHYYLSTSFGLLSLVAFVLFLFVLQGRKRAALMMSLGLVVSMAIIEAMRLLVPRRRPPDAQNWLGASEMVGSFPSGSVFLFMLVMTFAGFALWSWLGRGARRYLFVGVATVLTVNVALSQFFLAIHFVSDVVGGIVGAVIVGFIVAKFLDAPQSPASSID